MIDYSQVLADLKTLLAGSQSVYNPADQTKARDVLTNANDRDYVSMNMPLIDLRMKRAVPDPKTNVVYYTDVTVEIEIAVMDLTSLNDAATIRDDLVQAVQSLLKANRRFGASVDDTILGSVDFAVGEDAKAGAFLAGAVMELHVFVYSE